MKGTIGLDEPAAPGAERILRPLAIRTSWTSRCAAPRLSARRRRLPDLLAGSPVLTGIRLSPDGGTLVVSGRTAHGAWEERVDVPATEAGEGLEAISALWARETIENLELDLACGETRRTIDAQIEAIALRHSIPSRLTSWIAVADVPSVDPREPVRVERIPQMLPDGMSAERLGLIEARAGRAGRGHRRRLRRHVCGRSAPGDSGTKTCAKVVAATAGAARDSSQ